MLVVVDTAAKATLGMDRNDSTAADAFMDALTKASIEHDVAVLLVAHDTKASRDEARAGENAGAGAMAGSAAWFDSARTCIYLRTHSRYLRELECTKANDGEPGWMLSLTTHREPDGEFAGFREPSFPELTKLKDEAMRARIRAKLEREAEKATEDAMAKAMKAEGKGNNGTGSELSAGDKARLEAVA